MPRKDGLPSQAFAYVGDPEDPATWKLPLWDNGGSGPSEERCAAAAKALTSLPSEGVDKAKAKVRAAYIKLGKKPEDMPDSIKETPEYEFGEWVSLSESAVSEGGRTAEVVVIQPGFNYGRKRFYPKEVIAKSRDLFEGVKMYIDHATEAQQRERPEGTVGTWVGNLSNVRLQESGAMLGTAQIHDPGFRQRLTNLKEFNLVGQMGVSIRALGAVSQRVIDGVTTHFVESFRKVQSVDFVTEAGAGGCVLMVESKKQIEEKHEDDDAAALKQQETKVMEQKELEALQESIKAANTAVTECKTALVAKDAEIAELKESLRKSDFRVVIAEKLTAVTDLPEQSKTKLLAMCEACKDGAEIDAAIKAEGEYVTAIRESVKSAARVTGVGDTTPIPDAEAKKFMESKKEQYIREGKSQADATRMAAMFCGLKE
jgi:hypothetical protein